MERISQTAVKELEENSDFSTHMVKIVRCVGYWVIESSAVNFLRL